MVFENILGWEIAIIVILAFIFLLVGCITAFIILSRLRWPFVVNVLQDTDGSGKLKISLKDRARLISFGDGGEEIFLLKKSKKYRIGYGKRIGNKAIAWAVGDDGYWYNITFQGVDRKLLEVGVMPVDRDMRFATASIRKGIDNRYDQKSWMDKYGAILYFGLFFLTVLAFGGVMWFAFSQQAKIASSNIEAIKTMKEVMELAAQTLANVDNIRSNSGAIV